MIIEVGRCYQTSDGETFEVEYVSGELAYGFILTQNRAEASYQLRSLSELPHWKSGF